MRIMRFAFLVSVILTVTACAKSGEDGKAFASVDGGTSDVTALDMPGAGAPPDCSGTQCGYFFGKRYEINTGTDTIFWKSNTTFYQATLNVTVNDGSKPTDLGLTKGKNGDDKDYQLFFSGNTMSVSSAPVPSLSETGPGAMNPTDSRTQIDSAAEATGLVHEGVLKEMD